MMASRGVDQLLGFITSIVIARFLSPFELGLATEAVVFVSLVLVVGEFGFAPVIIQRERLREQDTATAFWASLALGAALTLIGVGLSWPIAALYGEPRLQPLFAVMSLTFLFTAAGLVQEALLMREMDFRALEVRTILAVICSCTVGITLAALGFGPWAIVVQTLTISAVASALVWRSSPWRPTMTFSVPILKEMWSFASHVTGSRILNWAQLNVDNLLVGRFLGAANLGVYSLAFAIGFAPVNRLSEPLGQVLFPAFSRIQDRQQIALIWLRASRMLALIAVPAMLGLIVIAHDFVQVVFGQKWMGAVVVLQLLAPISLFQTLTGFNASVLQSIDRTRLLLRLTAVTTVLSMAAFAGGLPWGIKGVAVAYLIATVVLQSGYLWLTARAISMPLRQWLGSVSGVLQAGLLMLLVVAAAREALLSAAVPAAGRLAVLILLGVLSYAAGIRWRAPEAISELKAVRQRRREPLTDPATT